MKTKSEIIYGIHSVTEALKAGRRSFFEIFFAGDKANKRHHPISLLAKKNKIPVKSISSDKIQAMAASTMHQGVCAGVTPYPVAAIEDILLKGKSSKDNIMILILDSIKDPHNLGALVRTALCAGVNGIIIPKDRAASPSPTVSRASAGAMEHILISEVTNLTSAITLLKKEGIWIMGADVSSKDSVYSMDMTGPLAIVVGEEEKGIRPLVKKNCDFLSSLPQTGPLGSLNASVAGALIMYEAFRQKKLRS